MSSLYSIYEYCTKWSINLREERRKKVVSLLSQLLCIWTYYCVSISIRNKCKVLVREKKQIFNHVSLYKNTNFLFCYIIVKLVWFIRLQIRYMCGKSMTNNNGMKKKKNPKQRAHTPRAAISSNTCE